MDKAFCTAAEIYLIRHGQSQANAGLTAGCTVEERENPPLTEAGKKQAQALGGCFSDISLDAVLSSGMKRALSTAAAITEKQKNPLKIEINPIFTEVGVSEEYAGAFFSDIKKEFPMCRPLPEDSGSVNYIYRKNNPSDAENLSRAKKALDLLKQRFTNGERAAVVSHAAFLTSLMLAAMGLDENQAFDMSFDNAGVSKLVFYKSGKGRFGKDIHIIYHNRTSGIY